ncbi:hypothetical protein DXT97_12695 [Agrobacterium tumefaciens]|uniref:hypothetical protein n=1 Tax=Agrobacterium tumefaciens TaxID=358 RepID=UPI0012971B77|nr:hypothetical protein [Agrobacterium tumefaciens]MQB37651.1 hypothetical protein [Agrobacterium tumefaciens]
MTALEEIKKALEGDMNTGLTAIDRLRFIVGGVPDFDPITVEDADWLISALESLQRENEMLRASRDGYVKQRDEILRLYDEERISCIREAKLATDMAADCNDAQARAEAAEAEVARLQAEIDRKSSMPGDHRYWEGRYRDEADENDRLRGILFKCGSFIADRYQEGDAEYQVVLLVNDAICRKPALASTGGEHHGN